MRKLIIEAKDSDRTRYMKWIIMGEYLAWFRQLNQGGRYERITFWIILSLLYLLVGLMLIGMFWGNNSMISVQVF